MDTLTTYRQIVQQVLSAYVPRQYAHGNFHNEAVFDEQRDRYVIMSVGWDKTKRVHGSLIHIDIINGKLWIQRDGTEEGVALDLEEAGIPKEHIVLAFRTPNERAYSDYAVE